MIEDNITCVWLWTEEIADGEYIHYVSYADDEGEPIGKIWNHLSTNQARLTAYILSEKAGNLPIESELKTGA